jgi:hypothetical protein
MFWIELTKDYLGKKAGERLALDEKDAQPLISSGIARPVPDDPLGGAIARRRRAMDLRPLRRQRGWRPAHRGRAERARRDPAQRQGQVDGERRP